MTLGIKGLFATLSIIILSITKLWFYAECHSTECRYAECLGVVKSVTRHEEKRFVITKNFGPSTTLSVALFSIKTT